MLRTHCIAREWGGSTERLGFFLLIVVNHCCSSSPQDDQWNMTQHHYNSFIAMVVWSTETNTKWLKIFLQLAEHPVIRSKVSDEKYTCDRNACGLSLSFESFDDDANARFKEVCYVLLLNLSRPLRISYWRFLSRMAPNLMYAIAGYFGLQILRLVVQSNMSVICWMMSGVPKRTNMLANLKEDRENDETRALDSTFSCSNLLNQRRV